MLEKNLFLIIVILLVLYYINNNLINGNSNSNEAMSLGTVQQMYAQDNQNIALNGYGNDSVRSADFALRFNQPSRMVAGTQRGARASRTNRLQLINDAYTGDYGRLPLFDIAKPIIYDELNLR